MIFLILLGLALVLVVLGVVFDSEDCAIFGLIAAVPIAAIGLLVSVVGYTHQVNNYAQIAQYKANQQIYVKKSQTLTREFTNLLAVRYPNLEKSVYVKFASNPNLVFTMFPQLRSADTFTTLANEIGQLQSNVYDQELNITKAQKDITVRKRNPWLVTWILPNS